MVLQKAALKKLYKEASQDVLLIGRYAYARSWKALNKEETSLCLNFIFQFVSKYWQSCTVCSMEKLYSEYHSLRNVKLQGEFPGGSPGGFPGEFPGGFPGGFPGRFPGGSQGIAS